MASSTNESSNWVALLGTKGGPAVRPGSSMPTSNLLCIDGKKIVVDCGLGVTKGLIDQQMELKDLSLVLITHLHSDHYLELGPLLHTAWTAGLKSKVQVYGPYTLAQYWSGFLNSMDADISLRIDDEGRPDLRTLVDIHVIEEGAFMDVDGLTVQAMRNTHPPLINTFALRFNGRTRSIVFSGDTAPIDSMEAFSRGADLLIHEAMLEEALESLMKRIGNADDRLMKHWLRSHTFAEDAAKIATNAGVKALALNHRIPADDPNFTELHWRNAVEPHWNGVFYLGSDGLRIELD